MYWDGLVLRMPPQAGGLVGDAVHVERVEADRSGHWWKSRGLPPVRSPLCVSAIQMTARFEPCAAQPRPSDAEGRQAEPAVGFPTAVSAAREGQVLLRWGAPACVTGSSARTGGAPRRARGRGRRRAPAGRDRRDARPGVGVGQPRFRHRPRPRSRSYGRCALPSASALSRILRCRRAGRGPRRREIHCPATRTIHVLSGGVVVCGQLSRPATPSASTSAAVARRMPTG